MESFLENVDPFLNKFPDHKPKNIAQMIRTKSSVLYFPLPLAVSPPGVREVAHVIWPHRWEHDKNPETFFKVMTELISEGFEVKISVLGEEFQDVPACFEAFKSQHSDRIIQWGRLDSRDDYLEFLKTGTVVVSTALHEFFGVSMLEATAAGCFPLCPNRLVYPEIYPAECLYNNPNQLKKQLRQLCKNPDLSRKKWERVVDQIQFDQFSIEYLTPMFEKVLLTNA